ncbi:MAG: lamin tail domain-containing protein [Acidobacteriota bacterium]|nr:lamin tail domain-containing protein [Acidobacteriota bacterium]
MTAAIPEQSAGTTVKYIVSAWNTGGGPEVFGNSGSCTNSSCAARFQYNVIAQPPVPLIISEFRLRGLNGADDEFIEIYNNSNSPHTVAALDGSAGYGVAASDGVLRFAIPNGTVIPARGHYLVAGLSYFSTYPYGAPDRNYAQGIADNAGIALFKMADAASFNLANRLDAVGSTAEPKPLYKEGAGYAPTGMNNFNYSFSRDENTGSGGSPDNGCAPLPKDSNDNAADFLLVYP